jgi:hypothetical protein
LDLKAAYEALLGPLDLSRSQQERENAAVALVIRSDMGRYDEKLRNLLSLEEALSHGKLDWNDLDDPRKVTAVFNAFPEVASAALTLVMNDLPSGLSFDELKEAGEILATEHHSSKWTRWKDRMYDIADRFGSAIAKTISAALTQTAQILRSDLFEELKNPIAETDSSSDIVEERDASGPFLPRSSSDLLGPS